MSKNIMEVSFLVYFKNGTVLYLLQENNSPELLLAGQVHTVAFLITLMNFYLFIRLAPPSPSTHMGTHACCFGIHGVPFRAADEQLSCKHWP